MTTDTKLEIQVGQHEGITTWSALGQHDKSVFLTETLRQHNKLITEKIRSGRIAPTVEMVDVIHGMPTEGCGDGTFISEDIHDSLHSPTDPVSECDWDPAVLIWVTMLCDEAMYPQDNYQLDVS